MTSQTNPRQSWQRRIFFTAWITYASLYLGRVNISVALPTLQDSFGWSKSQVGLIGSAFFWLYAMGQLLNGTLGDRLNPRRLVTLGLLGSAVLNAAFGLSSQLPLLIGLWGLNGYVQSTGWGPIMRVLSNWFSADQRGKITALFGPCYTVGHVVSWLMASYLISRVGWRTGFWVPGLLLFLAGIHWFVRIRKDPQAAGLQEDASASAGGQKRLSPRHALGYIWRQPRLRWIALTCLSLGAVKESLTLWIPTFLLETEGLNLVRATGYAIWLPLAGAVGIALAGSAAHRFARQDETPVIMALFGLLALSMALYRPLTGLAGAWAIPLSLGFIGSMVYGANGLLLTALPMTHSERGRVSTVAGFLDFASYMGSGLGGGLTGLIVDHWNWDAAFGLWSALAALGASVLAFVWLSHRDNRITET
jgi:OPA family glycerol-3-phosphate transporter-like MFS transporter